MLTLLYITNSPQVAQIADRCGVDRIWIDLETLGKEERQGGMNTVKSHHQIEDIPRVKKVLQKAELLVRINPMNPGSYDEIEKVIEAGADRIMLPMWKSTEEVQTFLEMIGGRVKNTLLLETKEAMACLDEVLELHPDEIHIGLNDLHLSLHKNFMFELLSDRTVEELCRKIRNAGIPYGFGGIARLHEGLLPAEHIIMEHYRLGSTRAILSRSFLKTEGITDYSQVEQAMRERLRELRAYEEVCTHATNEQFEINKEEVKRLVAQLVARR